MRTLGSLLALLLFVGCAAPQRTPDERAVIETVQAFFDVIASRDVQLGAQITVPEGVFVNVREQDGARVLKHFKNADWLATLPDSDEALREYFIGEPTVLIDGDVAVVWTRYGFEKGGRPSHTGSDAFVLVRGAQGWKIAGGGYSVVF